MEIGLHPGWRFVCDLDGGLQDALRYDVGGPSSGRLGRNKNPVIFMAADAVHFDLLLKGAEPLRYQMNILKVFFLFYSDSNACRTTQYYKRRIT